jgi:hypothetical protein
MALSFKFEGSVRHGAIRTNATFLDYGHVISGNLSHDAVIAFTIERARCHDRCVMVAGADFANLIAFNGTDVPPSHTTIDEKMNGARHRASVPVAPMINEACG